MKNSFETAERITKTGEIYAFGTCLLHKVLDVLHLQLKVRTPIDVPAAIAADKHTRLAGGTEEARVKQTS